MFYPRTYHHTNDECVSGLSCDLHPRPPAPIARLVCDVSSRSRGRKKPVDPDNDDDLPWGHEGFEVCKPKRPSLRRPVASHTAWTILRRMCPHKRASMSVCAYFRRGRFVCGEGTKMFVLVTVAYR